MPLHNLTRFPRLEFIGAPTPLEYLPRFSDYLGREIFIKRDDVTPMAMGGNKLRKLEFLAADALREAGRHLPHRHTVYQRLHRDAQTGLFHPGGPRADHRLFPSRHGYADCAGQHCAHPVSGEQSRLAE